MVMEKENFDSLLEQFQQCESLDKYVEVMNALGAIDENYAEDVRRINYMVFAVFTAAGKKGLEYLTESIGSGNERVRGSSVHVILELGRNLKGSYREAAIILLKERLEKEGELKVKQRITYALEQLGIRSGGQMSDIDFQFMSG